MKYYIITCYNHPITYNYVLILLNIIMFIITLLTHSIWLITLIVVPPEGHQVLDYHYHYIVSYYLLYYYMLNYTITCNCVLLLLTFSILLVITLLTHITWLTSQRYAARGHQAPDPLLLILVLIYISILIY